MPVRAFMDLDAFEVVGEKGLFHQSLNAREGFYGFGYANIPACLQ